MISLGVRIVPHPLATQTEVKWFVMQHPNKKRRRNWRAVRTETVRPAAFKTADGTIYMHPELYAKLPRGPL